MDGGRERFLFIHQRAPRYVAIVDECSLREDHACAYEHGAKDEDGDDIGDKRPVARELCYLEVLYEHHETLDRERRDSTVGDAHDEGTLEPRPLR